MRQGDFITEHRGQTRRQDRRSSLRRQRHPPGQPRQRQYLLDLEREAFKSLCGEKKDAGKNSIYAEDREDAEKLVAAALARILPDCASTSHGSRDIYDRRLFPCCRSPMSRHQIASGTLIAPGTFGTPRSFASPTVTLSRTSSPSTRRIRNIRRGQPQSP